MKDLISREALLQQIGEKLNVLRSCNDFKEAWGMRYAMVMIQNAPAVDAVEVVHGRWVEEHKHTWIPVEYDKDGEPILHDVVFYRCNLCGRIEGKKEPFCNCGADMRDGE